MKRFLFFILGISCGTATAQVVGLGTTPVGVTFQLATGVAKVVKRVLLGAAAVLMLLPNDAFAGVVWLELAGLLLGGALVLSETGKLPWTRNAGSSRSA